MPDSDRDYPDPREEDIMAGDRRLSRPDASLPDWEVPDSAYRPIPIVWFTAAVLAQMAIIAALFAMLSAGNGVLLIVLGGLGTGIVLKWTWDRGMKDAGRLWQAATVIVPGLNLLLLALAVISTR